MSKDEGVNAGKGRGEHNTRRDTERITYDRARTMGYTKDAANQVARKISDSIHNKG